MSTPPPDPKQSSSFSQWLIRSLLAGVRWVLQQVFAVLLTFAVGTAIAAILLWYRDLSLWFAPIGGLVSIGAYLIYLHER